MNVPGTQTPPSSQVTNSDFDLLIWSPWRPRPGGEGVSSRRVEPQKGAELKMAGWEWEEEREEKERAVTRL